MSIDSASLRNISLPQLEKMVKRGMQYSNQRLIKLEKANLDLVSPAYQYYKDRIQDGRFQFTTKNRLRLISDLRKIQHFLNTKTSTVKGAKAYYQKVKKLLPNVPIEKLTEFWEMYSQLREDNDVRFAQVESGQIVRALQRMYDASKTREENMQEMEETFNDLYNKANEEYESYGVDPDEYR